MPKEKREPESVGGMGWAGPAGALLPITMSLMLFAMSPWAAQPAREVKESTAVEDLGVLVITPGRAESAVVEEPYSIGIVDSKEIEEALFRTVPDALSLEPSVMVQKTSLGQGSPYIRGFTGLQNLHLIDGFRLNHSVFRQGPNQYLNTIDPYSIDRIEILKGPGSVLYGSDAIGGTVNALTWSPLDEAEDEFGVRLLYRGSTAERSTIGRAEIYGAIDETFGYSLGLSGKDFGDLEGGRNVGRQKDTGYDEYDADVKLEWQMDPETRLIAAYQRVGQNNVPRTHSTIYGIDWKDLTVGSEFQRDYDQEREFAYLLLLRENLTGLIDRARFGVSWHEQSEDRHRIRTKGPDWQGFDVGQFGAMAQFESEMKIGRFVYGIDYYHDNVNSYSSANPIQGPVADDAGYDLLGIYLQGTFPLFDRKLDLILGGRYDYAAAAADSFQDPATGLKASLEENWDTLAGNARLLWHLDSDYHYHLYAGVSQGFRAPNLADLTQLDSARTNEFETAAAGLDPEYYLTCEAGIKVEYDHLFLELAYYHTWIDDMIIRYPTGAMIGGSFEVTKDNVGDGYIHGVEFQGRYRFHPRWTVFTGAAWMEGEADTYPAAAQVKKREPLDRLMPPTGHLGLRWEHLSNRLWIQGLLEIAGRADDLSTRDKSDTSRIPPGGTPGYEVVSLYAGWEPWDRAKVNLAVENLFDEDYRIHGSGVNEPGRNFIAQLEYRF